MTSSELREKFLSFFKEKNHTIISPASLVPENDPTVLFTTAGMHPLVPFLLGEKHPEGRRLANVQPCIRTDDIDEVGDEIHHTFFEMLGNWSLGDYWKKEAIGWSYEFLTSKKWLGLEKDRLAVSCFAGDDDALRDEESAKIWKSLGIKEERIAYLPKKDNWWGPAGETGPCGPDTEIFYWTGKEPAPAKFDNSDKRWMEIWNDVFMQYFKNKDGKYEPLSQRNVDTGEGLERILAAVNGLDDDYKTDLFWPIIQEIEKLSNKKYEDNKKEFRIIADHIKAAAFIIGDKNGVEPSNLKQGYVVRRLIRRAIYYGTRKLEMPKYFSIQLVKEVANIYKDAYPEIKRKENEIGTIIQKEEEKFGKALDEGIKKVVRWYSHEGTWNLRHPQYKAEATPKENAKKLGIKLFDFFQESATPLGISLEEIKKIGKGIIDENILVYEEEIQEGYKEAFKQHQELSRTASAGMFKGGLADAGEMAVKYHTATHLLLAALRQILGENILQKGSNITAERLRFDFNYPQKLSEEQIKKVEDLVNQKIQEDIPVEMIEMLKSEALKMAKVSFDPSKYGDIVKVYKIGDFSIELCGGTHIKRTSELGRFKIAKEESSSAGIRRIKAILVK